MCVNKRYSTQSLEAHLYARVALEPASKDKPLQYTEVVKIRVMINILSFFSALLVPYFVCLKCCSELKQVTLQLVCLWQVSLCIQ